jgi:hypothetical protein
MKTLQLIILIILAIFSFRCNKENYKDSIPQGWTEVILSSVVAQGCGCNTKDFNEIKDFKSTVVASFDSTSLTLDSVNLIVVDTILNSGTLIIKHGISIGQARICNYPKAINSWNFNGIEGIEVMVSGIEYQPCIGQINPSIYTYSDIVLTKLLKKSNL